MPSSAPNSGRPWRQGCEMSATPSAQPKLECFCGTLGAIGQRGVPVQAHLVWGIFVEESADAIPRALSYHTAPRLQRDAWHRLGRRG
jgi:hypothetical protein